MATNKKVYLEITNKCNLNCDFCPGTTRKTKFLNEKEFDILSEKIKKWANYVYFHLMGEPTMHMLLPDFAKKTHKMGLKPILTTNGTLFKSRFTDLINSRFYKVNISLHAFEANTLLTSFDEYINECLFFAKKAAETNTISVLRLWNLEGKGLTALNKQNDQIIKSIHSFFPNEWTETRSGYKLDDRIFLEWGDKFDWPNIDGKTTNERGFCYGLRDQIGILCDGTVVPCCLDNNGHIALGNLFYQSLEEILSSEKAKQIHQGFTQHKCTEDLCKHCMRAGYYRKNIN